MRVSLLALFGFFTLFSTLPAHGQLQAPHDQRVQVRIASGPSLPYGTSDFSDQYQLGYSITSGLDITLTPDWRLSLGGTYSYFNLHQDAYRSFIRGSNSSEFEGHVAAYSGTLSLKHLILTEGRWIPYFAAGLGVYYRDEADVQVIINDRSYISDFRSNSTLAGGHVSGGIVYRIVEAISLYMEPRYTATASLSNTANDTLDYLELRMGLILAPW